MRHATRLDVLRATYRAIESFHGHDARFPCVLFGAVIDRSYSDREERAYEGEEGADPLAPSPAS